MTANSKDFVSLITVNVYSFSDFFKIDRSFTKK